MRVAIVGAGIGGLTTALRLHADGIDCAVYEQGRQLREVGVGINVLPQAVKELFALGLADRLDEVAVQPRELIYTHRLGQEIMRRPCGLAAGFTLPQFSVHRGRLQGVLARAVRERRIPLHTEHRLAGFDQDEHGVTAHFADRNGVFAPPVEADALVGADGIHSAVRANLFPDEGAPLWNGVMMWRGATDWPEFAGGRSILIAGGIAAKLVVYPIAAGESAGTKLTNWVICIKTGRAGDPPPQRQDWARPADLAELSRHIGRFSPALVDHAALIAATGECFEFPMCDRDPLPHWTEGRVTLLGDAAHPMYPVGSNGAAQSILDAVALSACLTAEPDPARALRAYQDERLPATTEVVLRNRSGGPEGVIEEVGRRAPDGFDRLADVITQAELDAVVSGYLQASGGSQQQVNR